MNTQPTQTDIRILNNLAKYMFFSIFSLTIGLCFIFATYKPEKTFEYRPIVVSSFTRALNTAYQPSASRFTLVSTSSTITSTLSLTGGQSGSITLQTSPDNVTYTTQQTQTNNNTGTLTIGLNTAQVQAGDLSCTVPPGYYYKFVSSGTSTFAILATQETSL